MCASRKRMTVESSGQNPLISKTELKLSSLNSNLHQSILDSSTSIASLRTNNKPEQNQEKGRARHPHQKKEPTCFQAFPLKLLVLLGHSIYPLSILFSRIAPIFFTHPKYSHPTLLSFCLPFLRFFYSPLTKTICAQRSIW